MTSAGQSLCQIRYWAQLNFRLFGLQYSFGKLIRPGFHLAAANLPQCKWAGGIPGVMVMAHRSPWA